MCCASSSTSLSRVDDDSSVRSPSSAVATSLLLPFSSLSLFCSSSHSIMHSRLLSATSIASFLPSSLSFFFFSFPSAVKTTVVSPGAPNTPVTVASGYLNSPFTHATSKVNNSIPLLSPSSQMYSYSSFASASFSFFFFFFSITHFIVTGSSAFVSSPPKIGRPISIAPFHR